MRNLKAFGLVLVAALALSGLAAAQAFATYDSELIGAETTLKGEQSTKNVFHTREGTVECEKATFEGHGIGTMEEKTGATTWSEITVHPTYSSCRAFGLAATVNTTGCNYKFTTATTTNETGLSHAKVHIECEAGKRIEVNAGFGTCKVFVGEQTPFGEDLVDFQNEGTGSTRSVTVTSTVGGTFAEGTETGITYTAEGGGCPHPGTFSDGSYTGSVKTKGFSGTGTQVGIWVT